MTLATTASSSPALLESTVEKAWQLLESLTDPEIPVVTLRELGILRDVRTAVAMDGTEQLEVVITPTYSGCPAMGQIEDDVHNLLQSHGLKGKVKTQLAPAWTTDWITPRPKKNCALTVLRRRTAVLIMIAKPRVAKQTDLAPPASFNSLPAAQATLAVMNCLLCPARNAIQTTPPKHHTLALPPAKRFTAASIAWSPLTISNLIDATAHFKHDQQHIKLKNFAP